MELAQQVEIWRQKSRGGQLTAEEMQQAIAVLRQGRMNAAKPEGAKAAEKRAIASIDFGDI